MKLATEEILFGEVGLEVLFGVGSGTYKVDVNLSKRPPTILAVDAQQIHLSFEEWKRHVSNVLELDTLQCLQEKASWEQYKMFLKDKFGLGPELTGKTIEVSQDLGSESVEPQVVDEIRAVDEIPAVDGIQTVDGSQLITTESTQEAFKNHLNVGAQATVVINDKSRQKRSETKKYVNRPCSYVTRHEN